MVRIIIRWFMFNGTQVYGCRKWMGSSRTVALDKYGWKPHKTGLMHIRSTHTVNDNRARRFCVCVCARILWELFRRLNASAWIWQIYTRLSFCKQIRAKFPSVIVPMSKHSEKKFYRMSLTVVVPILHFRYPPGFALHPPSIHAESS